MIGWLAEAAWLVFASGHGLGAVFNQLVRSRAQLLGAAVQFVPSASVGKIIGISRVCFGISRVYRVLRVYRVYTLKRACTTRLNRINADIRA